MDFHRFDMVTWDSIKDLRCATYVQPPPRLSHIMDPPLFIGIRTSTEGSCAQQLAPPGARCASESNCAHFLEARLDLFCAEDWPAPWAMVRAACDVASVSKSSRTSAAEQKQSRVRKVATLARPGERGRALAAARNAHQCQSLSKLCKKSKVSTQQTQTLQPLLRLPCRTSSCPKLQSWFQTHSDECRDPMNVVPRHTHTTHWYEFGEQAGESNPFVQFVAHSAAAAVPHSVLQYLRSGQVTPLVKSTGGHRPLLMMSFLALKQPRKNRWPNVLVHSNLACDARTVPTPALDPKTAFQNVSRRAMLHSIEQSDPDLATVFSRWSTGTTEHTMHDESAHTKISANSGVDQGCPLSTCGFSAAIDPVLRNVLAHIHKQLDPGAKLFPYLNKWYLWIKPQNLTDTLVLICAATR